MKFQDFSGDKKQEARKHVADFFRKNAHDIRKSEYASHVTEEKKDKILAERLLWVDEVEAGKHDGNFSVWQRMNHYLTGESVPLLSK